MGSCVSSHKNLESRRWWVVGTKTSNKILIQTPIKEDSVNGEQGNVLTGFQDSNGVSKDDMFFDAGAYLESDNEDFCSVNGDFTPSRGNTPVHPSIFLEKVPQNASLFQDEKPGEAAQPSPIVQKRLAEFLYESFTEDSSFNVDTDFHQALEADRRTETGVLKPEPETLSQSVSCCIPNMPKSLSFSSRKKLIS